MKPEDAWSMCIIRSPDVCLFIPVCLRARRLGLPPLALTRCCRRLVDNVPCATRFQMVDSAEEQLDRGYRLGLVGLTGQETFINNHLRLVLYYHTENQ